VPTNSAALTFDDGPDSTWTPRILDALAAADARATFFVIAPLAVRRRDLIERMQAEGHRVELHCDKHVRHTELGAHRVTEEARLGVAQLRSIGLKPTLWRTPWGVRAPFTDPIADRFGLRLVQWTADTHDWRGDDAAEMLEQVPLEPGDVVLAHDGLGPGALREGCEETVALIDLFATRAADRGLTLDVLGDDGQPA
jgi:peptidoglycan/xylan/chitin deacetylase (PgdA/CDA1 family)